MEFIFALIAAAMAIGLYFLPLIIAGIRNHHQAGPIAVLNLFLGWTLIGWVVCFAWSLSHISPAQRVNPDRRTVSSVSPPRRS